MQFVKTCAGKTLTVDGEGPETIAMMKHKIHAKEGGSTSEQGLIFQEKEQNDTDTLLDCNIGRNSTVSLTSRLRGGASNCLYVKTLTGKTLTLKIEETTETIKSVKQRIQAREGIAPGMQRLFWGQKQLDDERTLDDYNLRAGVSLFLVHGLGATIEQAKKQMAQTRKTLGDASKSHAPSMALLSTPSAAQQGRSSAKLSGWVEEGRPRSIPTRTSSSDSAHRNMQLNRPASTPAGSERGMPRFHATTGRFSIPHPNKVAKGGEDAYVVCTGPNGTTLTAVLDGVGGWSRVGVDPGKYSKSLARRVAVQFMSWAERRALRRGNDNDDRPLLSILERAYAEVQRMGLQGSCTVCLALQFPDGRLHVLNVGDSGVRIVRDNHVVFATAEQQHAFNYPVQLGSGSSDVPADGDYHVKELEHGDTVIVGTDGVFDNLWEEEYLQLVSSVGGGFAAQIDGLARRIAEAAHHRGLDALYFSPFASQARREGMVNVEGGKLDDVTCVVSRVARTARPVAPPAEPKSDSDESSC